ncbi:MAG: PAS domain-containing protein [Arcanobacterium sp.]|nr:PAS domain-containing protein [Arcanobacterium sp.]MDY5588445.1 histidine kinase [Arcanobacterium sp.]
MEPTGAQHEVGVDELFFSTTDSKGVIERSNSVFTRLSRYSREQLVGAPHNIIRHPLMPGGAFYAMWEALKAGKPFAAYVHNLAADGSRYDVFATITPMRDGGFLSVRTRPMARSLFEAADAIYARAFDAELHARNSGMNRHDAAVVGAGTILELLAAAGYGSYEDFMYVALPEEVAAREAASSGIARRDEAWGEEANMLRTVHFIFDELNSWMVRMNELAKLSSQLEAASNSLQSEAAESPMPDNLAVMLTRPELATVKQTVDVWQQMQTLTNSYLAELAHSLRELRTTVAHNRFQIALSRLHTTMLAQFLAEVIDGGEEAHNLNHEEIDLLHEALDDGVAALARSQNDLQSLLSQAAAAIEAAVRMIAIPKQMTPIIEAQAPNMPHDAQPLIPMIVGTIEQWGGTMEQMGSLAAACKQYTTHDATHLLELIGYLSNN